MAKIGLHDCCLNCNPYLPNLLCEIALPTVAYIIKLQLAQWEVGEPAKPHAEKFSNIHFKEA